MARITVATTIDAPVDEVWADVSVVSSHTQWMHDAVAIRFRSPVEQGVGAAFDCDTRVGPLRLTDRMEVVEWRPREAIGIRHVGLVTGTGRFTLTPTPDGHGTRFTWDEELRFPRWLGGRLGAAVAAVVLRRVWRRNLAALAARFPPRPGPLRHNGGE